MAGQAMMMMLWLLSSLLLLSGRRVDGLTCNLCNNADLIEDCFINHESCRPDYVCFVEIQYYTLSRSDYATKTMKLFSMGCQHFDMCRDRRTHGPGAYGYATHEYRCCCTDYCHEADGVGLGRHDVCPTLWRNRTRLPSAACRHPPGVGARGVALSSLLMSFLAQTVADVLRW